MAQVEGLPHAHVQAVAFHMYFRCKEETTAFEACAAASSKPASECAAEYKAVAACAKGLVDDAVAKAKEEWHHYTHCLDMMSGKYNYCKPERAAFVEVFPLES